MLPRDNELYGQSQRHRTQDPSSCHGCARPQEAATCRGRRLDSKGRSSLRHHRSTGLCAHQEALSRSSDRHLHVCAPGGLCKASDFSSPESHARPLGWAPGTWKYGCSTRRMVEGTGLSWMARWQGLHLSLSSAPALTLQADGWPELPGMKTSRGT